MNDRGRIQAIFAEISEHTEILCRGPIGSNQHNARFLMSQMSRHYVFWSAQHDEVCFDEAGNLTDALVINHSGEAAARHVYNRLKAAGLAAWWPNTESMAIRVSPNKSLQERSDVVSPIKGIPQVCPECGQTFYSTAAEDTDIKRGWLAAEVLCPNHDAEKEGTANGERTEGSD